MCELVLAAPPTAKSETIYCSEPQKVLNHLDFQGHVGDFVLRDC